MNDVLILQDEFGRPGLGTDPFLCSKMALVNTRVNSFGRQQYQPCMTSGYTGFVPRLQTILGHSFSPACNRALAKFEQDQWRDRLFFKVWLISVKNFNSINYCGLYIHNYNFRNLKLWMDGDSAIKLSHGRLLKSFVHQILICKNLDDLLLKLKLLDAVVQHVLLKGVLAGMDAQGWSSPIPSPSLSDVAAADKF